MTVELQTLFITWFFKNKREMPWRNNPSPYRVWVSEVMLQQTTVATVRAFFLRFMDRFPTLADLSLAEESEVLLFWAGLGYYSRARNLLKTAKILKQESNFPCDIIELKKLPGIGNYTAAAISSIAFNQPDALVDTNVDRVLGRFFALKRNIQNFEKIIFSKAQDLMDQASKYFPQDIWVWNQAVMELGALICLPAKPECPRCPLNTECRAFASSTPNLFPGDKVKSQIIEITESVLVLQVKDQIVLAEITKGSRRRGLYDFISYNGEYGEKSGMMTYRISNNKVTRTIYKARDDSYQISDHEVLVDLMAAVEQFPLTSPCKKTIHKMINVLL